MFERDQIAKILAMHGVTSTASDEDIRTTLVSARWDEKDINAAIYVLRDDPNQHRSHEDVLHQVIRTDDRLQPETIKSLLGISIDVSTDDVYQRKSRSRGSYSIGQLINIAVVSVILGVGIVVFAMWSMDIGIFQLAAQ